MAKSWECDTCWDEDTISACDTLDSCKDLGGIYSDLFGCCGKSLPCPECHKEEHEFAVRKIKELESLFFNAVQTLHKVGYPVVFGKIGGSLMAEYHNDEIQIILVMGNGDEEQRNNFIRFGKLSFENSEKFLVYGEYSYMSRYIPIPQNKAQWSYVLDLMEDAKKGVYLKRLERKALSEYPKFLITDKVRID